MELWLILFLAGLGLVGLELVLPMMFWMPLGLAAIATAPVSYFVDHWSVLGIWPILSMVLFIGIKKSFSVNQSVLLSNPNMHKHDRTFACIQFF